MTDRIQPQAILGTTGLKRAGGYIIEEPLANLRGQRGMKFYGEMVDTCSVLGAVHFVVDSLVRQVPWRVATQKGQESNQDALKWKEWLEGVMLDMSMSFEDFISECMSAITYGHTPFEIVYKRRKGDTNDPRTRSQFTDGLYGWRRLDIRAQDTIQRWEFGGDDNGLTGFWQQDPYVGLNTVFIPMEKALLMRTRASKNNPEGRSLMRACVRDYHFWKRITENEAIGVGRDLTGMLVASVPPEMLSPNATADMKYTLGQIERMVQQAQVDERMGAVFPSELNSEAKPTGFKLALLGTPGSRSIPTDPIVKRYEARMLMNFMAEFIMIGQEKVGTQALYAGKSNLFGIGMGTLLNGYASVLNNYGVARLMTLNNVPRPLWPIFEHGDVSSPDLDKLGTLLQAMSVSGVLSPNKKLEGKILEGAGLPPPDEEADPTLDDSIPTPADGEDVGTGLLSDRQVKAVLDVNASLKKGDLDRPAAIKLLGATLGLNPAKAAEYISAETDDTQKPEETDPRKLERGAKADVAR